MAIAIKKDHVGRLHEALGIPQGEPIPMRKIMTALKSNSPSLKRMDNFAKNSKGWNK